MHYTISKDIKGQCHEIFDTLFAKIEKFCLLICCPVTFFDKKNSKICPFKFTKKLKSLPNKNKSNYNTISIFAYELLQFKYKKYHLMKTCWNPNLYFQAGANSFADGGQRWRHHWNSTGTAETAQHTAGTLPG